MMYEIRDLVLVPGHGVAFCHGLHHVAGRLRTGQQVDMWWRATQGLRLVGDNWQIVHEHSSLPFDMATGKVSFALKP
jgi:ketosteroid isomerase-like protein